MEYESRVNERQIQTTEEKTDTNSEKGFVIAALKNELRKLTGNSVNTKFAKPSILGKPVEQPLKNQSVVRQPTAFKSERPRISKPRPCSSMLEMTSVYISSGLVLHQMTFDHNRSELEIQDHSNEQSSVKFKAGSKSCSSSKQDSYIKTRVGITIPPSYSNAKDN
ncbi:hypothetical protein Tco_0763564, partial [Tanacetum coccineum]